MKTAPRRMLTYANVVSTLCLLLLLGGGVAVAASQLAKNSVGAKQLRKNAVTTAKIKKGAVTGAKIKLRTLGTVPNANHAASADSAASLTSLEAVHFVGAPGQPPFESGSTNFSPPGSSFPPVSFYKDHEGIVHVDGFAQIGKSSSKELVPIFTLPPGFRPPSGIAQLFKIGEGALVFGTGSSFAGESFSGSVVGEQGKAQVLDGITFRAGS